MLVVTRIRGGLKRVNHAAVAVNELIYSFGGFAFTEDNISIRPIDVHTLNMNTLRWEQVQYSDGADPANVPFMRYGHSVSAQDDIIYLWGGRRDRWSALKVKGTIPQARGVTLLAFSFSFKPGIFYMASVIEFCGVVTETMFHATKCSCFITHALLLRHEVTGTILRARGGPAAFICAGHILGGYEEATKKYCDKVFRFNLKTLTGTIPLAPKVKGTIPTRGGQAACISEDFMYILGGFEEERQEFADTVFRFEEALVAELINSDRVRNWPTFTYMYNVALASMKLLPKQPCQSYLRDFDVRCAIDRTNLPYKQNEFPFSVNWLVP
uniref:Uncharacterized protein n=1 Tax=Tetranychus urticae TaxID=32264 RepID=T1KHK2_TETUR